MMLLLDIPKRKNLKKNVWMLLNDKLSNACQMIYCTSAKQKIQTTKI